MNLLTVKNLSVHIDRKVILEDVSFELGPRERLSILGPNGAGKTILLRALLNLVPFSGDIAWGSGARIGYVPQKLDADRHLPLTYRDLYDAKCKTINAPTKETTNIGESVGLTKEMLETPVGHLSGGQFQRGLIGFALQHTDYSDGRSTLEEMVEGAASLGYEYVALIDHSPSARVAHGLSEERLEEKIEAIERLRRQRRGRKPRILMGAEVDILSNGKLDYSDKILARLDVVVGSVHSAFRQSRDRMTGRLLDAVSNPYVQIIGHPTTRLIGGREAINFDFDQILRAVIEANVAFEIDSQPDRLDLTDTLVKAANEAGALFAINSDAHSLSQLEYLRYGIFDARRGWTGARSVINSWTWTKLSRWLEKRRSN